MTSRCCRSTPVTTTKPYRATSKRRCLPRKKWKNWFSNCTHHCGSCTKTASLTATWHYRIFLWTQQRSTSGWTTTQRPCYRSTRRAWPRQARTRTSPARSSSIRSWRSSVNVMSRTRSLWTRDGSRTTFSWIAALSKPFAFTSQTLSRPLTANSSNSQTTTSLSTCSRKRPCGSRFPTSWKSSWQSFSHCCQRALFQLNCSMSWASLKCSQPQPTSLSCQKYALAAPTDSTTRKTTTWTCLTCPHGSLFSRTTASSNLLKSTHSRIERTKACLSRNPMPCVVLMTKTAGCFKVKNTESVLLIGTANSRWGLIVAKRAVHLSPGYPTR